MTEKKLSNGLKLVFAPGAFDSFEGTQEELDELIKQIEEGLENGSFFEKAQPVDFDDGTWSEEDILRLEKALDESDNPTRKLN